MADEESSPRAFRRERNLSNRNFNKRASNRRRFSTESHNSVDLKVHSNSAHTQKETKTPDEDLTDENDTISSSSTTTTPSGASLNPTTSSSMNISYSVNSDTENDFNKKSLLKMRSIDINLADDETDHNDVRRYSGQITKLQRQTPTTPQTPDPALLDVKQKLLLFENLHYDESSIFKSLKYKSKSSQSLLQGEQVASSSSSGGSYLVNVYPKENVKSQFNGLEERSEDEVESILDEVSDPLSSAVREHNEEEVTQDDFGGSISLHKRNEIKDDGIIIPVAAVNQSFLTPIFQHSKSYAQEINNTKDNKESGDSAVPAKRNKDFPRNYRSRPKTEVISGTTEPDVRHTDNCNSLPFVHKQKQSEPDDDEQIELRDKSISFIEPILEELIKTEESYVENLWSGINNYGNIFQRSDLPIGLRGKKYVLFGNIEQIAEFHRDEFLPMLQRNKHDLKTIFDEFKQFIDSNYFYGYVLFTMNKQRSLKLCDVYKNYFKLLQNEIGDKLGINSFLVQPIQRMARYPLLLQQFITTLFKNRDYVMKPIIESCCRLEKKLRNLLITTNESEIINDIVCVSDAHEFNTFYQGKFRKVSEFQVFDHSLKRSYRSKVFIFDKCIIYTEIKGKQLLFHGRYPCEHIGIMAKSKQFTLYYDQRKQQECDFMADQALIDQWLDLLREMITAYAVEERRKLKELHCHEFAGGDHMHRKPANLSLFRDSNRFSSDSGIGNIWVLPKPDQQEEATNNRTTWYAVT